MKLSIVEPVLSVCRLNPDEALPTWAIQNWFSITKTDDELSIVCEQKHVPQDVKQEKGWRALKVAGPLDFSLTGILYSLTQPLAEAKISLFAISTFDTDYILLKEDTFEEALRCLKGEGHQIS